MKKWILLLSVVAMTLGVTACNGGKSAEKELPTTAYGLYTYASEAMKKVDSVAMNTNGTIDMTYAGQNMKMEMNGSISEIIKSPTDIDMMLDMKNSVNGQAMPMKAYYKGGVYYIEVSGQKMKMDMPIDKVLEQANTGTLDFPETAVTNQTLTDGKDGKELAFTLDGAALNDVMEKQLGSLKQLLGDKADMHIGTIDLKAIVDKDGMLKSTHMIFPVSMDLSGQKMEMNCDLTTDITQIGGIKIEFPTDLDTYTATPALGEAAPAQGEAPAEGEVAPTQGEVTPAPAK